MENVTIWHNQNCSKSREAMSILEENGTQKEVFNYLQTALHVEGLKELLSKLNLSARELMRTKETLYTELSLADENSEERLIEAMVKNPILIERPIIIKGSQAIIGRPTSKIAEFLK